MNPNKRRPDSRGPLPEAALPRSDECAGQLAAPVRHSLMSVQTAAEAAERAVPSAGGACAKPNLQVQA